MSQTSNAQPAPDGRTSRLPAAIPVQEDTASIDPKPKMTSSFLVAFLVAGGVLFTFIVGLMLFGVLLTGRIKPRQEPVPSQQEQKKALQSPVRLSRSKTYTPRELYREIDEHLLNRTLEDIQFQSIRVTGHIALVFPDLEGRPRTSFGPDENGNYGFELLDAFQAEIRVSVITGQFPRARAGTVVTVIGDFHYNAEHGRAYLLKARIVDN